MSFRPAKVLSFFFSILLCALPLLAAVGITISPTAATVNRGATRTFTATVSGTTNTGVTWSVVGTGNGTITTAGVYSAPIKAGTFTVRATSKADTSKVAAATVTVPTLVVSVNPATATVNQGATQTFSATVSGAANTGVTWSVTSGGGAITTSGLYTAPAKAGTFTVTASSKANPAIKGTATVTVPMKVTLSPSSATLNLGQTQAFTATVTGNTNKSVTWSVVGGSANGTITTGGLFTPPAVPGTYSIQATTVATPAATATASVTVRPVAVSLSPTSATVSLGATRQFTATVTGAANTAVTWSVSGGATPGTVSNAGLYTAPAVAGTCTVTATSVADATEAASAVVTVPLTVSVSPSSKTLDQGATQVFSAAVGGSSNQAVTWSATSGSIAANGTYTAPGTAGTYTVTATTAATPVSSANATVTVRSVSLSLSPTGALEVPAGEQFAFTATVSGTTNKAVTWSVVSGGGSIASDGTYTAPVTPDSAVIKATSAANASVFKTASITVLDNPGPIIRVFQSSVAAPQIGQPVTITWDVLNATEVRLQGELVASSGSRSAGAQGADTELLLFAVNAQTSTSRWLRLNPVWPEAALTADRVLAEDGETLTLTPAFANGHATLIPDPGQTLVSGQPLQVLVAGSQEYRLVCANDYGYEFTRAVSVTVRKNLGSFKDIGVSRSFRKLWPHPMEGFLGWSTDPEVPGSSYMNEFIHHLRADGTEAAPSLGHPVNGGATMAVALDDARIAVFSRPSTSSFEVDLEPWTKAGGGPGTHYLHSGMDGSILLADGRILVYGSTANLYNPLVRNTRRDAPAGPPAALVLDTTGLVRKSFPSMVRLLDGRVLISGGWGDTTANYESPFSRESYLFDPATSAFTHVGDRATVPNYPGLLPGESSDPGLASGAILLPDGRVLFLGVPVANERAVNEIFDPVTGLFTVLGPAINELGRCEPVLLPNGQVLLGGAGDLAGFYDPATNRYHSLVGPAGAPLRADARARLRADALAKTRAALAGGSNHGQLLAASGNSASTASILLPDGRAVMPSLLSGSTTTEVFTPNLAVKVLPAVAWLNAGVSRTFSVELATPQSVAWSCLPADGAVLPDGTFSATRPGIYVLTATAQDGSKAHAFLHVQPQARLELSDLPYGPGVVQLYRAVNTLLRPSASRRFHAVVDHAQDQRVQWSVVEAGGGSVAWDGTYTAPATEGNYTLRAVSMADPSQVATLTITITTAPVSIFSFTATPSTVASGSNTTLRWALDGAVTAATLTSSRNETWNVLGLGQLTVTPLQPTTYTLTVSGPEGGATRSLPVQVTGYVRSLALSPTEATTDATQASPVFTVNIELAPGVDPTLVWSATGGTCTSTGPTTATWAPPGTPGDYLITATSVADPSVSATALVHLLPPQVVITLTPSYATVQPGQVFQFGVATNAGNVTWSADRGAITTDGWFTAPDSGTAIVTATSTMNPAIQETAAITIRPVDVVVAPSRIVILKNATYRFSGFASTGGLTWSVVEPGGGGIDATGLYTAPAVNGTFTVKAASALDGSRSATATVIVGDTGGSGSGGTGGGSPPPAPVSNGLSVNPQLALMRAGTYQSFSAEVWRVADQAVTWSVVGAPATAAIDADGVFTAGAPGTYVVKATSAVDGTVSGTSTVIMQSSVDAVEGVPADLATRQGYSVTALPNGKILLAGGWDGSAYVGSCYLFDPGARTFVPTASLAIPRSGHEATLLENGKVLITGGKGTVQWRPDWNPYTGPLFWGELYDPASGSFEPLPPNPAVPDSEAGQMQSFHHGGTGVALKDGRAFVIGGDTFPNQPNSKTSIFDPGTGVFTRDPLMFGHWTAAASLEDGRLLITGGWDANYDAFDPPPNDMNLKLSNQAWLYGPDAQGTWGMSPVPRSPEPG